ncbi:enolase 4 isoform X7 [Scyliorhinus torazame]|uniref:enolase 4 isoform X7 n=1 Tax=Scyliorhinus torazame TaxID=75743 RepID=UPI003B59FA83
MSDSRVPSSNGRSAEQARDFHQLKQRAAEYYRSNSVPQRMQEVLNTMFYDKPDDVYGHLANYFANFAKPAAISRIVGKEILDAEGERTVEVELFCIIKNFEKSICFTTMSNCYRDPHYTTQDTMDKANELKKLSVQIALEWINEPLNSLLKGLLPANQIKVDKLLSEYFQRKLEEDEEQRKKDTDVEEITEPELSISTNTAPIGDKKKKPLKGKKSIAPEKPIKPLEPPEPLFPGGVAIGAVSLAVAKASVKLQNTSLYLHIASLNQEESLKMMMDLQQQITKWIFTQKSGEKEKYEILIGVFKNPDEMIELYTSLVEKYPSIIGLIDPLRKEDAEQWFKLSCLLSPQCYFLADAASRSIDKLIKDGLDGNRYSGLILKHTNQTTISDFIQVAKLMEVQDCRFIPGLGDGATTDDSIADIAVGLGARFIKLGGLCHGERVAKYNRLMAIEEELAQRGALGHAAEHQFPVISEEEPDPN